MFRIPLLLEDDVLDGDQAHLPMLLRLVDEGLWLVGIDVPRIRGADEVSVDVVDAHGADWRISDTRDPGGIGEQGVPVRFATERLW